MNITQSQYNASNQKTQDINIIIQLLNHQFQILDEIQGVAVGGSISVTNGLGVRRSCNLTIHPKDNSFTIQEGSKIWIDKYFKVIVEVKDIRTSQYVQNNMGIFVMTNPNQFYDSVSNTISLEGLDLIATLNGYIKGNLKGNNYVIKAGENVRQAIIAILQLNGYNKYSVINIDQDVPNDIIVDNTGSYFDLLSQLCEILPHYQMYFDVDGTFIFSEIPLNEEETIIATNELFNDKIISWNKTTYFSEIKNMITVIGKTHEINNFAQDTTVLNNIISMELINITRLSSYTKIGFIPSATLINPKISLNDFGVKDLRITNSNEDIVLTSGVYYVMSYRDEGDYFEFYGEVEPRWTIKDIVNDSPFNVYKLGEIDITLSGGDYDNIYTTDLARQRAEWELYTRTRLKSIVELEIVPIYWLNNVNEIISLQLPNKQNTEELSEYIINEINYDFTIGATQSLNISKYYPFYTENQEEETGIYLEGILNNTPFKQVFDNIDEMQNYISQHKEGFTGLLKAVNTHTILNLDTSFMFNGCVNVEIIDMSNFNLENNISMRAMFQQCNNVHTIILPNLSKQLILDTSFCFYGCQELLDIDVSTINTSMVANFDAMFFNCLKLNYIDFSSFNLNQAKTMSFFLAYNKSLQELDFSFLDFSGVEDMGYMLVDTNQVKNAYAKDVANRDKLNNLTNKPNSYEFIIK